MTDPQDKSTWKLLFTVEVAAMYHDWRRGTLGTLGAIAKGSALVGAVVSIVVVNVLEEHVAAVVTIVGAITGVIILIDLVFGIDRRARIHDDLYSRCKELQALILEGKTPLPILEAAAQRVWKDEPPILWAIYAKCWNQLVTRYESEAIYKKKVGLWAGLLGNFIQFSPQDFEPASS